MTTNLDNITDIVAIDGPAGSGKSTVARRTAKALGFAFLDTGAMYRAATWRALDQRVDLDDPKAVARSTRAMSFAVHDDDGVQRVFVDGRDVTDAIRSPEVTSQIYRLDQNREVRAHLVQLQREFGAAGPTVVEGRDIGTVVFPKAKCKVFLDASLDVRTQRRARDLAAQGVAVDFAILRAEIVERDRKNRSRAESPLRCAEDATSVDTTAMTVQEVVDEVVRLARAVL